MAQGETYEEFIQKFKAKKTTDECYTPKVIYEVIKDFVVSEYGVNADDFIRPFYPTGDYKRENYQGKIVVDNPPFSIMSEIIRFYAKYGIKYFLFCSCLTAPLRALYETRGKYLNIGASIIYENGAKVRTSFCTNLGDDDIFIKNYPKLKADIEKANENGKKKKQITKLEHHENIITPALIIDIAVTDFEVKFNECEYFQSEKIKNHKKIFGVSFLVSDEVAKAKAKAKAKAYELPKFALNILDELNGKKQNKCFFD